MFQRMFVGLFKIFLLCLIKAQRPNFSSAEYVQCLCVVFHIAKPHYLMFLKVDNLIKIMGSSVNEC